MSVLITNPPSASGGTPGGLDAQIQYNNAGTFGGATGLSYNSTTQLLTDIGGFSITNAVTNGVSGTPTTIVTGDPNTKGLLIRGKNFAAAGTAPNIFTGLRCWLKADAITGLIDGDAVTTWNDSSGSGFNATQSSASLKPIYKTNILNGNPAILADGVNDLMTVAGLGTGWPSSAGTVFIVFKFTSSQNQYGVLNLTGTVNDYWRFSGDGHGYFGVFRNTRLSAQPTSMPVSGTHIFAVTSGGGVYKIRQNGTQILSTTDSFGVGTDMTLFNETEPGYFGGYIAEVIVYTNVFSNADMQSVEEWLGNKYAISVPSTVAQASNLLEVQATDGNSYITVGADGTLSVATISPNQLNVNIIDTSKKGITLKAASSQTANTFEMQNSSGTALTVIDNVGNIGINMSAPTAPLSIHSTTVPATLISLSGSSGSWSIGLGNEAVNNIYIGGSNVVLNYFWRANWVEAGIACNTFKSANNDAAQVVLAALGTTSQTAPLLQLRGISSTSAQREQIDLDSAWASSTDASRKARGLFRVWDTAAREAIRMESNGSAAMLGFFGHTANVQPSAYAASNVSTDRTFDASATSLNEVANVLGTLIQDLQTLGVVG